MATVLENKLNAMLGMDAEELDALGEEYDNDEVALSDADTVLEGYPLDYIGSKRETFVIGDSEFRQVRIVTQAKGCSKSDIYRAAVREYLDKRAHALTNA